MHLVTLLCRHSLPHGPGHRIPVAAGGASPKIQAYDCGLLFLATVISEAPDRLLVALYGNISSGDIVFHADFIAGAQFKILLKWTRGGSDATEQDSNSRLK